MENKLMRQLVAHVVATITDFLTRINVYPHFSSRNISKIRSKFADRCLDIKLDKSSIDKSIHRVPGDRAALHMHRVPDLLRGPRNRLPQIRLRWSRGLGDTVRKYNSQFRLETCSKTCYEGSTHAPTIWHASLPNFRLNVRWSFIIYFFERARIIGNRESRRGKTIDDRFKYYWIQWKGEGRGRVVVLTFFFQFHESFFFFKRERERTVFEYERI